jgi:hypothetical protein
LRTASASYNRLEPYFCFYCYLPFTRHDFASFGCLWAHNCITSRRSLLLSSILKFHSLYDSKRWNGRRCRIQRTTPRRNIIAFGHGVWGRPVGHFEICIGTYAYLIMEKGSKRRREDRRACRE